MPHPSRRTFARWAAIVLLIVVVAYPLSYAPVVRIHLERADPEPDIFAPEIDGDVLPIYKPIDWLIDETPARKPLFLWARLWGVENRFRVSSILRNLEM
jgi:hypothetical protein